MTKISHRELRNVESALRKHAEQTLQLADRVAKLTQAKPEPSGLAEIGDDENIGTVIRKAHANYPDVNSHTSTWLINALRHNQIKTVGDLRTRMESEGKPGKTVAESPYWYHLTNMGSKTATFLARVVEDLDL